MFLIYDEILNFTNKLVLGNVHGDSETTVLPEI